ncbi:Glucose dehydrogenase [acceptor] [Dufourea novaeangliae]|uniref:Glucose dehydrogenase [acceptor] n=1 Tax=Dufourea novaeangliae TaxID=178035 RepID=A0A154PC14_DUFNO|nr:Glucose dehydrogenase [acceptor] [Dufourea novaeangliae]
MNRNVISIFGVTRILFLVLVHCAIFDRRSHVCAQRKQKYANLYGFDDFNSSMTDNIFGAGMGALNFLYNDQLYQQKAQPDMTPTPNSQYDFIVVGAGTAGATIASRLSEISDATILLIEAGPEETLLMDIPILASFLQDVDEINWKYETEPSDRYCMGMRGHKCKWPRGKVMGGSSVLNYMIATRGSPKDYDNWAKMGNTGWAYKDVLQYFKKLENILIPELRKDKKHHGTKGPVTIDYAPYHTPLLAAFLNAGQELGYPLVDYNSEKLIGFSQIQSNTCEGYRMSSNKAYLMGKGRRNLHVTKMSMVQKILINKRSKRAIGVQFMKNNRLISVYSRKEVILCAGAIGSPQLLMLSGVGPGEHLRKLGINVIKDSRCSNVQHVGPIETLHKTGPFTISGGCEGIAFVDVDDPKNRHGIPNIELISLVSSIYTYKATMDNFGFDKEIMDKFSSFQSTYSWGIFPMLLRPKSRGQIRLRSSDVNVKPRIVANYLNDPEDIRVLVKGIRVALKVSRTESMRRLGVTFYNKTVSACEKYPFDSDDYWLCNSRMQTLTIYHYCGSCKMGPATDPTAVVDPTLKVIGIKGLRVADASIIPEIPTGHTNIPVFMIAEKLSDMVKKEWGYLTT